uniref:Uncharacterized protein n=1 Tax=Pseudomonas phage HRDY3 TaxID=3236930 RepID=A0AB39CDK8_9VIRU
MQEKTGHVGATVEFSSAPSDKLLEKHVGLNTSSVMLGLLLIFLFASFAHEWASKQRKSRLHRAAYRLIIVSVSLACAGLLIYNYQGMK